MDGPDRREVLGLAAGMAAATDAAATAAVRAGDGHADVVVIGAGAFGGWTALSLQERGVKTMLVDAYGAGNPHASSGGESRNIQFAYGDREIYTRWAKAAWDAWKQRQEEFGRQLLFPSGSLRIRSPAVLATHTATFDRLGLPYEMLSPEEVSQRWPQIRYDNAERILYERDSGIVKARDSLIAVSEMFARKGGIIKLGYAMPGQAASGRLQSIQVGNDTISAGHFVFACGPWLPKVLPAQLAGYIKVPRRELFYLGPARGDLRYRWENCPYLSDSTVYTSSDIGGGYKIAPTLLNVPMDPDDGDRLPTHFLLDQVHAFVAAHLPGLVGRPVIASHVCQLERTDNDHYIVDRHPEFANVWIAGGGSGHAFKMGPVSGPYVADRIMGQPQTAQAQALFGLQSHGKVAEGKGG
jgi:glycine/D-amino acid oxidase-like deaminating enzyme